MDMTNKYHLFASCIASLLCFLPVIINAQLNLGPNGRRTPMNTNEHQISNNFNKTGQQSNQVSGSASFVLPELENMENECLVRASCKLRHHLDLRPKLVQEPASRIVSCYCDNKCHLYEDCCSDAADFAPSSSRLTTSTTTATSSSDNDESVEIIGEKSVIDKKKVLTSDEISSNEEIDLDLQEQQLSGAEPKHKWHCQRVNGNLGGMQLLAECPQNWADEMAEMSVKLAKFVERRCTFVANPNLQNKDSLLADYQMDPLGMMMPITDLRSGITFANSYCLRCNQNSHLFKHFGDQANRHKLVSWSPVLDCNYDSERDDRNSLYDLVTQHKGNALQYNNKLNKWTVNTKLLDQDDVAATSDPEPATSTPTQQPQAAATTTSDNERICTIAPSAPDEVKPHFRYCHSNAIRQCANAKLARARQAQSRVCQFGPQQILFSKTSDRVYQNLACALCNGENSTSIDCKPSRRRHMSMAGPNSLQENSATSLEKLFPHSLSPFGGLGLTESRSNSPFASSFSILFDLTGQSNAQVPGAVNRCKGVHQVYDPFFMTCRCLMCGLNREYRDGKCVTKLHMMAENMAFSPMPMRMLPSSKGEQQAPSDDNQEQGDKAPSDGSEVALNSPQSNDFSKRLANKQQQVGLQMLIPRQMPEAMKPPIARATRTPNNNNNSKWPSANEAGSNVTKRMTDLDSEFEQILMKLALADLPEPSVESREKFVLCGKITVLPQHYRLFTLSDRLSINSHANRQQQRTSRKIPRLTDDATTTAAPESEPDDTAFMLLNDQDQKHQKRRHARSGTYALRIWAYVKPYNLLLPSSQFELIRPDSISADEYEMNMGANLGNPSDPSEQDQRFELLICAPFKNDLGQKFSLEMAYVTSICLTISIASLTLYLVLYMFSMFNLNRLLKKQRKEVKNLHKISIRSDQTTISTNSNLSANYENFPESPSTIKQKWHPNEANNNDANCHRKKRALSEAPSTVGMYSSSSCRRKSLSSQGVACLATSLLASYLLFILNNVYVANKKDAILSQVPNVQSLSNGPSSSSANNPIQTDWGCKLMALATIYCFLVAFNWMLLLSYDIWRSVRLATVHLRPPSSNYNGKRFMSYLTFSLVCSASVVGLALLVDEMPLLCMDEKGNFSCTVIESTINAFVRDFKPHFGYSGPTGVCWFNSRKSLALFFGFPVTIIVAINLIYFVLCSFMVIKTTRRSRNNRTKNHIPHNPTTTTTTTTSVNYLAPARKSISEQPTFFVHRMDDDAGPFANRRPHHQDGMLYGSKRSANTVQSSLGGCSYLSSSIPNNQCNQMTNMHSFSSSGSCSTIYDGEITPPIDSLVLANQHNQNHEQLSMAEIIKAANNNARPPSFEELDAAGLAGIYQHRPMPSSTPPMPQQQSQVVMQHQHKPKHHFKLEPQTSSVSLMSNSSSTLGNATSNFATSIAAKYDARKHQLSSMMNTVIQDYRLYCRLSTIMGLTWLFGIMAAIVDRSMILWHLFIIFNTLQGLFIFIAFGLKREKLRNVNILIGYMRFRLRKFWTRKVVVESSNNSRKGSL